MTYTQDDEQMTIFFTIKCYDYVGSFLYICAITHWRITFFPKALHVVHMQFIYVFISNLHNIISTH